MEVHCEKMQVNIKHFLRFHIKKIFSSIAPLSLIIRQDDKFWTWPKHFCNFKILTTGISINNDSVGFYIKSSKFITIMITSSSKVKATSLTGKQIFIIADICYTGSVSKLTKILLKQINVWLTLEEFKLKTSWLNWTFLNDENIWGNKPEVKRDSLANQRE